VSEAAGRINTYTCQTCERKIVTVNVDEGTTPMMLGCRAPGRCAGTMVSAGYRCDQSLTPTHEWYRPTLKNARRKGPEMLDHVKQGGLALRAISGATP
jgi:hypothetical protein